MNASSKATSLKLVLPTSLLNLAMYSSAVMPIVIFRGCSWAPAVLSQSGSPKVLSVPANSSARVENVEVWDRISLVSFSAHTCAIPPCMKERAYRIFILSSENVLSCSQSACSSGSPVLQPMQPWLQHARHQSGPLWHGPQGHYWQSGAVQVV